MCEYVSTHTHSHYTNTHHLIPLHPFANEWCVNLDVRAAYFAASQS